METFKAGRAWRNILQGLRDLKLHEVDEVLCESQRNYPSKNQGIDLEASSQLPSFHSMESAV